jgi:hypothetical protein
MNPVERILFEEATYLGDRLATSIPPEGVTPEAMRPRLRARLEEAESELAKARASVLEDYGRWRRALEDAENLWALAVYHSAAAEQTGEHTPALAA